MPRTFAAMTLVEDWTKDQFPSQCMGRCDQCGNGATLEDLEQHPSLYQVELVGTQDDPYGNAGVDEKGCGLGYVCRACYDRSKERTFMIYLRDGEDPLVSDLQTIESAMQEIITYLQDPLEYGKYAPFHIVAQRDSQDMEHIATIDMPEADKAASRQKAGY